jgi:hypothetical protein
MADLTQDTLIEPYDIKDLEREPRPDVVVYRKSFTNLRSLIKQVIESLERPLMQSKFHNNMTKALLKEIQDRTKGSLTLQVMFAVSGAMESGRSITFSR